MKKQILLFLSLSFLSISSFGQSIEKRKSKTIGHDDAGAFLLNFGAGKNNLESFSTYMTMEFFVSDDISIGIPMIMGFQKETINNWKYSTLNYSFGLNANYHLNRLLNISYKWDLYLGANGGYNLGTVTPDDWNAPETSIDGTTKFYGGGQIGLRYYFTPVFGLNAEGTFGSLRSGANLGITLHF